MTDTCADRSVSKAWMRALECSAAARRRPTGILAVVVEEHAAACPSDPALLMDGACWSYSDLASRARHYAGWAVGQGLRPAEAVCLLMANCPDYVAVWLGISRVGSVVALLNTNLTKDGLVHCARKANARYIIMDALHRNLIGDGLDGIACWQAPTSGEFGKAQLPPLPSMRDTALLIYTSGTTGLPKAAKISHARLRDWSYWFAGMMDTGPGDRMYNCLPMYHSVGGVVAIGALLVSGGAVVIRENFSASRFWDDIAAWDCTLFQYIGESCRYLVNSPPHPRERAHRIRLCCGNGLRPEVWNQFASRFKIPSILEFYASTEGNVSLYNVEGRPGSIGRVPGFLRHRSGLMLVQLDPRTGEPARGADGRCIPCVSEEPGEALGRITDDNFEGYTDPTESERKILRDVFEPGDAWFRTWRPDAEG